MLYDINNLESMRDYLKLKIDDVYNLYEVVGVDIRESAGKLICELNYHEMKEENMFFTELANAINDMIYQGYRDLRILMSGKFHAEVNKWYNCDKTLSNLMGYPIEIAPISCQWLVTVNEERTE